MTDAAHKQCYGRMVGDVVHADTDRITSGKVFDFQLKTAGGAYRGERNVRTKIDEWDHCLDCAEFDACYKLSLAKLAVEGVVVHR